MTGEAFWRTDTGFQRPLPVAAEHVWELKKIAGQTYWRCALHGGCPKPDFPDQGLGFSAPASDAWDIRSVEFATAQAEQDAYNRRADEKLGTAPRWDTPEFRWYVMTNDPSAGIRVVP